MKLLDLLAQLGLWPFDSGMRNIEAEEAICSDEAKQHRPIVVPRGLQPVVHAARWPTENSRRTLH
jgi:hypothetical protein